ncbi:hypothetical protein Tco_0773450 [Tanacetum coccineum]|uniref:Uncharacterized protein n=1 Tax=Tanacetum coccineum TaxID=301880 RepID=A0ABQ4ZKQ3_9ASTR
MDNRRPRTSSFSPSSRSSTTRTSYRPQRPKKIMKSIWVKKGSTVDHKHTSTTWLLWKYTEAEYVAAASCCAQRLINVVKVHTYDNVADLLTKGFDLAI